LFKAVFSKGGSLDELGKCEEAIAVLDQAIQINPNYHVAYESKSTCLRSAEKHEENLRFLDEALKLFSNQTHNKNIMLASKGESLLKLNRYNEALTVFELAIENDRQYGDAYIGKIKALQKLNRVDEANRTTTDVLRGDKYFINKLTRIQLQSYHSLS
jgi:tetratricopeptide (TPR) repeat protein